MSTPNFPGWYPDPERPSRERLWDGQAWTDHLRRTADEGRFSPRTIVASVAGLVVLLLVWVAAASGDDGVTADPATSQAPATTPLQQTPTTAATPTSEPPPTEPPSPTLAKVPDVEGLALAKAKRALRAAELKVGKVDRRPSSKKKGTVLKQSVAEGTEVEPGSRVSLVVAAPLPRVPAVVGQSEASAIRDLKDAGFTVKKKTQTSSSRTDGVVLSQSPSSG